MVRGHRGRHPMIVKLWVWDNQEYLSKNDGPTYDADNFITTLNKNDDLKIIILIMLFFLSKTDWLTC
jgi:hypothetical protein